MTASFVAGALTGLALVGGILRWKAGRSGHGGGAQLPAKLLHAGLIDMTPEVIISVDAEQRIIAFNRSAEEVFGCRAQEVLGEPLDRLLPDRFAGPHRQHVEDFAAGPQIGRRMNERGRIVGRRKDGTEFPAEASITKQVAGGRAVLTVILRDVSERERMEQTVQRMAFYDPLTALPNRNLLYDRLQAALQSSRLTGKPLALLLMDLDNFRDINDTLGHRQGDQLLLQLGERLRKAIFERDFVARLGGDEFAVLLQDLSSGDDVFLAVDKIAKVLQPSFTIEGVPIAVETSIGIALYPEHCSDVDTLIQRADIAMYAAKKIGQGHAVYAPELDPHSPQRLGLMSELRDAIERGELVLHYQPIIGLAARTVLGVEALVRWRHPERGMIPPDQFIGLAEQTGLIHPLTRWVLETATRQCSAWQDAGFDLTVSVNLSARNIVDPGIPEAVASRLRSSGAAPQRLKAEITESAIMTDPKAAGDVLAKLHEMGLRVSIDDFGTGYSSLGYLRKLSVDEIKVDRSFVMGMSANEDDAKIAQSTIGLAHHLGLGVVAEGVETSQVLDRLVGMGCDAAQGYHFSRPLPAAELAAWLRQSPWAPPRP